MEVKSKKLTDLKKKVQTLEGKLERSELLRTQEIKELEYKVSKINSAIKQHVKHKFYGLIHIHVNQT